MYPLSVNVSIAQISAHARYMAYHNRSSIQAPTVIAKPLLVALILALVGCGSAPKVPVQPEEQPKAPKIEPLPDH